MLGRKRASLKLETLFPHLYPTRLRNPPQDAKTGGRRGILPVRGSKNARHRRYRDSYSKRTVSAKLTRQPQRGGGGGVGPKAYPSNILFTPEKRQAVATLPSKGGTKKRSESGRTLRIQRYTPSEEGVGGRGQPPPPRLTSTSNSAKAFHAHPDSFSPSRRDVVLPIPNTVPSTTKVLFLP